MVSRQASDTRSQTIYEDLHAKIASGVLTVGTRLPTERELATDYGAARNTVRKTMVRLSSEGLVERHVGRGSFVSAPKATSISPSEDTVGFSLNELLEARLLFEPALVELVLERATDAELGELEDKLDALRQTDTWSQFKECKYALHLHIVKLSGNSFLVHVFNEIIAARRAVAWRRTGPAIPLSMVKDTAVAENAAIVAALRSRDGAKASDLIRNNLLRIFLSLSAQ
jgi:GntR family transcriptional regulator, transcriptional repressor for pyruvate dehydrogenase complex